MAGERLNFASGGLALQKQRTLSAGDTVENDVPIGIYRFIGHPSGIPKESFDYGVLISFIPGEKLFQVHLIIDGGAISLLGLFLSLLTMPETVAGGSGLKCWTPLYSEAAKNGE